MYACDVDALRHKGSRSHAHSFVAMRLIAGIHGYQTVCDVHVRMC